MTNQAQRIIDLRATAANHRRMGNLEMAQRMEAKANAYEGMTEQQYVEAEIKNMSKSNFFQVRRAAERMAAELKVAI